MSFGPMPRVEGRSLSLYLRGSMPLALFTRVSASRSVYNMSSIAKPCHNLTAERMTRSFVGATSVRNLHMSQSVLQILALQVERWTGSGGLFSLVARKASTRRRATATDLWQPLLQNTTMLIGYVVVRLQIVLCSSRNRGSNFGLQRTPWIISLCSPLCHTAAGWFAS